MKQKSIFRLRKWAVILLCLFLSGPTFALVPFVDSGKLLRAGKNEIALHSLFISEKKGLNINGLLQLDEGFSHRKDINIRYLLGGESLAE